MLLAVTLNLVLPAIRHGSMLTAVKFGTVGIGV
jgi:hypothetical protein